MSFVSVISVPSWGNNSQGRKTQEQLVQSTLHHIDAFSTEQAPGILWNHFLQCIRAAAALQEHEQRQHDDDDSVTASSPMQFLTSSETLHTGELCHVRRVAAAMSSCSRNGDKEEEEEEATMPRHLVAKFINPKLWKRLTCRSTGSNSSSSSSSNNNNYFSSSSMLGKDRLQAEKHFVSEILATIVASSAAPHGGAPRVVGIGAFVVEDENDQQSKQLMCPCFFMESFDCSLRDLFCIFDRMIRAQEEQQKTEMSACCDFRRRIINQMRQQLDSALTQIMSLRFHSPSSQQKESVRLAGHLDICPTNILVRCRMRKQQQHQASTADRTQKEDVNRVREEALSVSADGGDLPFDFALADWGCSVWAANNCACRRAGTDYSSAIPAWAGCSVPDRIRGAGHVLRYGTQPFVDDRLMAVHQTLFDRRATDTSIPSSISSSSSSSSSSSASAAASSTEIDRCAECGLLSIAASAVEKADAFSLHAVVQHYQQQQQEKGKEILLSDDDRAEDEHGQPSSSGCPSPFEGRVSKLLAELMH